MKSFSQARLRTASAFACAVAFAAAIVPFSAQADQWDKKTILTVNQPIQVAKTVLQPGQYVFKLLDSASDRHIVQIFNGDQTHIIDTVLAIPNYRLQPTGHSRFTFWETPPGHARALRAWFYPGDNFGQEFAYPKQLAMLETSAAAMTTAMSTDIAPVETPSAPASEPTAERSAEAEEQPVETAENAAPPAASEAPAAPEAQPAPPEEPAPTTLPKTGSPYPLVGLAGLAALSLYGLLRLKRTA